MKGSTRWTCNVAAAPLVLIAFTWTVAAKEAVMTAKLNEKIPPITLRNAEGTPVTLAKREGIQATVVVFLSFECPVSTDYCPRLRELWENYHERGVAFVAICPQQPAEQVAKEAKAYRL